MSAACHDCGRPYGAPGWVEAVVPHEIWNNYLSPQGDEGGLLCIGCMADRAASLGLTDIPLKITAGPFTTSCRSSPISRGKGLKIPQGLGANPRGGTNDPR